MAVYPLSGITGGRDITPYRNPHGRIVNVDYDTGPDNLPAGAMRFKGRSNSYMIIPNKHRLDLRNSITLLAWVKPYSAGPIIHYNPRSWGVHFWMVSKKTIFARFVPRSGKSVKFVVSNSAKPGKWNYLGASYDSKTGLATIWNDGTPVAQKNIGRFRLSTNYPITMGRKVKDKRYFTGSISCVQIYSQALTGQQIKAVKKTCFRRRKYNNILKWLFKLTGNIKKDMFYIIITINR